MLDYSLINNDEEIPGEGIVLKKARAKSKGGTLTASIQPGQSVLPNALAAANQPIDYRQRAADLYSQGENMYQQYLDKNEGAGEGATLNALAAQFAGEGFQPLQAQFLKKAGAAEDTQAKKAEFLMQQAKAYEALAQNAETARERIAAQRAQNDILNQMKLMGLNMQQQGLDLRREFLAQRQGDESKNWRNEDNLRKDFDSLTKDLREQVTQTGNISQIISATPPGQKPDAITQQSLVVLLNKFLDPGSVVREGEFDRVVKAQGLEGRVANLKDRILKGQPLDNNTINQINGLAQLYNQAATSKMQSIANNYSDIAKRRNLNVESVISDPRFRGGSAPAPSASGNAAPLSPAEQAELARLRARFNGGQP